MPELSKDIVALIVFLMPGFLAAWIFYALTSHAKPAQFERTIQALIFTLFVKALVFLEQTSFEYVGQSLSLHKWDGNADLIASLLSATFIGFLSAYVTNTDRIHQYLRDHNISKRSAHPSEWCNALSNYVRFIVVHFKDDRRLYGWPEVWPTDPEKGHFFIVNPSWIDDDGDHEIKGVEGVLVNVSDVRWIEFVEQPENMK